MTALSVTSLPQPPRRTATARIRWVALGATVAVLLGSGGLMTASAAIGSGAKPVFVAIRPCTLVDTHPGAAKVGPRSAPLGPAEVFTQQVTGSNGKCVIPAGATAVAINLTVSNGTAAGRLTVYPANVARPTTVDLNWPVNGKVQNAIEVGLSPTGTIRIFNAVGTVHVRADVTGYFMDHNHDDRYFTKAQTNSAIATGVASKQQEVVALADSGSEPFTPPATTRTLMSSTFTTTKSGRLYATVQFLGGLHCSTGSAYYLWLTIDDVYVGGSRQQQEVIVATGGFDSAGFPSQTLQGLTTATVAAGTHSLTALAGCDSGNPSANLSSVHTGFVTVIP